MGFVAVAAGDGLQTLFTDLGCTQRCQRRPDNESQHERHFGCCDGYPGKDGLCACPNNKNIILAAEQTVPLVN